MINMIWGLVVASPVSAIFAMMIALIVVTAAPVAVYYKLVVCNEQRQQQREESVAVGVWQKSVNAHYSNKSQEELSTELEALLENDYLLTSLKDDCLSKLVGKKEVVSRKIELLEAMI